MRSVAVTLILCALSSAQGARTSAATHQVSNGACSINAANVRGNVTVSFSGAACNGSSASLENLLCQLVARLQSDLDARRGATQSGTSITFESGVVTALSSATGAETLPRTPSPFDLSSGTPPVGLTF